MVKALREESTDKGPMSMVRGLGGGNAAHRLPFVSATSRLLGALVNFLVIRPSGLEQVKKLGVLEIVVPLMESTGQTSSSSANAHDEDPSVVPTRALTLAGRLVREAP